MGETQNQDRYADRRLRVGVEQTQEIHSPPINHKEHKGKGKGREKRRDMER